MFYSLIYVSEACVPLSAQQLARLASICDFQNRHDAITGILLHKDGHFLQMLKGARRRVEDKKQRIVLDPRHRNVIVLAKGYIPARELPACPMVFRDLSASSAQGAYSEAMAPKFTDDVFPKEPGKARRLLLSFRDTLYRLEPQPPPCPI